MKSRVTTLTGLPQNAGTSVVTDGARPVPSEDGRLGSSDHTINTGAANQNKSSWISAAYSSTKVVVKVVKESSDVFPPLKSVASGLTAILKYCDI